MKQRIHNEWFQPVVKTSCSCGLKKVEVFAWGEYVYGKWNNIDYFCQSCFVSRVLNLLIGHARGCGCKFNLAARSGHSIPKWIKMPESCTA